MDEKAKECLQRYKQGDAEAIGELVELYRRPLFGFILKMTEGRGDAEDVFQDVWIRAIRNISSFKKGKFLSWLFRIAHNRIIDVARKEKRIVDIHSSEDGDTAAEERLPYDGPGPDLLARERDTGRIIRAAIESLPREQREVFLMRTEGDLPFKEIARIQGVSINTSLARMQYALEKLRMELKDEYSAGDTAI